MINFLKNRIFIAALMSLALSLTGGFAIMAPLLVVFRNEFVGSAMALRLWPVIGPEVLVNFFINNAQSVTVFVISAIVIFILYSLLWAYFSAGIYGIIVRRKEPHEESSNGTLGDFLRTSATFWPAFIKIAILSFIIYTLAAFIGLTLGQIFGRLWGPLGVILFLAFMLVASTYIQVLKVRIVAESQTSVREAIRATRPILAKAAGRLLVGNFSVMIAAVLGSLLLWFLLKAVRGFDWNIAAAILSVILEQAIVLAICLAQAIRINYNNTIIKRGAEDALGGNQLGGV